MQRALTQATSSLPVLIVLSGGKDDGHARTLAQLAIEIHASAMHLYEPLDDRQPQSRAALNGGDDVGPAMSQTIEKLCLILRCDANAGVGDAKLDLAGRVQREGETSTPPPDGVYLTAFDTRLFRICRTA